MGILIDLNSQIPDSRIPSGIARDTETTAAINAHTTAADPHPIYLTQTEGDARYRQSAVALVDGDIPAGIARDTETTVAINAHAAAADPHPIYLTQAEGDSRYSLVKIFAVDSIRTASTEGQSIVINHGLQVSKILGFQAIVEPFAGTWVPPNWSRTPGAQFVVNLDSNSVYITNVSGNSFNILNKPVRIIVHHIA